MARVEWEKVWDWQSVAKEMGLDFACACTLMLNTISQNSSLTNLWVKALVALDKGADLPQAGSLLVDLGSGRTGLERVCRAIEEIRRQVLNPT